MEGGETEGLMQGEEEGGKEKRRSRATGGRSLRCHPRAEMRKLGVHGQTDARQRCGGHTHGALFSLTKEEKPLAPARVGLQDRVWSTSPTVGPNRPAQAPAWPRVPVTGKAG